MSPGEQAAQHVAQFAPQGPTHKQGVVEEREVENGQNLPHFWSNDGSRDKETKTTEKRAFDLLSWDLLQGI